MPGGGDGAASHRPVRSAPGGRAACAQQRRPLRAVRRVRGAPAAIQLPGLISSRGVRLGAGSQRAAAAAPRSASRKEPAAAAGRGRPCIRAAPRPGQAPEDCGKPAAKARTVLWMGAGLVGPGDSEKISSLGGFSGHYQITHFLGCLQETMAA
ncbi:Nucleolar Mif4G Domain-Containing Protein 1 [Manis pentadactyla]|nr:Nucleolar Mif4G Domain-Containing Protein 1 [Manis pentadactyla]